MLNGYSLIFALIAMFFWGAAPIFAKIGLVNIEPVAALGFRSAVVTIMLTIYLACSGKLAAFAYLNTKDLVFIFLDGLCGAILAQLAFYYALKIGDAGKIVPIASSFPVVTLVLAVLFLGEKVTLLKLLGAAFIIGGIILLKY